MMEERALDHFIGFLKTNLSVWLFKLYACLILIKIKRKIYVLTLTWYHMNKLIMSLYFNPILFFSI